METRVSLKCFVNGCSSYNNIQYKLNNCINVHQTRSHVRAGGICIFLHKSLLYKVGLDLCVNNEDIETFYIDIFNKNSKSLFINAQYRHSVSKGKAFGEYLKTFLNNEKLK